MVTRDVQHGITSHFFKTQSAGMDGHVDTGEHFCETTSLPEVTGRRMKTSIHFQFVYTPSCQLVPGYERWTTISSAEPQKPKTTLPGIRFDDEQ